MKDLLKRLVETYGPSGNEEQIREVISREIQGKVDQITVDALGNLIAFKKGKGGKKVMFSAHMDEIGLVITHIDENGFLRFSNIGGHSPYVLLGQRVVFANGVVGVIGSEKLDDIKDLELAKMFIDIGAASKAEAEAKVKIGDAAGMQREFVDLGRRVVSKAMDDRVGCAVLVETINRLTEIPANDIYFVFSVQEEVGLRGAKTAAFGVDPDLGVAVDVTAVGDTPKADTMDVSLGKGAAIKIKDSSVMTHPKVKALMTEIAQANNIPYQYEVLERGGTDAGAIHLTREGVPSGCISIPCRYIHSQNEMVDMGDVEACVDLALGICKAELAGF